MGIQSKQLAEPVLETVSEQAYDPRKHSWALEEQTNMEDFIVEKMLTDYEAGRVSRRQLITVLSAGAIGAASAPAAQPTFQGVGLNHIAIRVTSIQRSRDFYQKHFGLPVLHEGEDNCFLGLGKNFLTLFKNEKPGLDHYCIAVQNFQADAVVEELRRQGFKPRRPSGSDRVYFPDPDGLEVQLSSSDHHA
jgi:catechol 2,3-dioxygenase-like lactoylglutathione lyase family enzyme